LNTDMRKFESSQKDDSRAQSADSSKAFRKRRVFICQHNMSYTYFIATLCHLAETIGSRVKLFEVKMRSKHDVDSYF